MFTGEGGDAFVGRMSIVKPVRNIHTKILFQINCIIIKTMGFNKLKVFRSTHAPVKGIKLYN